MHEGEFQIIFRKAESSFGWVSVLCLTRKLKISFSERLKGGAQVLCLAGKLDSSRPELQAGKSEDSGVQHAASWAPAFNTSGRGIETMIGNAKAAVWIDPQGFLTFTNSSLISKLFLLLFFYEQGKRLWF